MLVSKRPRILPTAALMAGAVDEVDLVRVVEAFGSLPPQDASRTVVPHTRHNVVGNLRLTASLTLRRVDGLERPSDPCCSGAPEPPPPGQTFGVGSRSGRRRPEEICRRHPHYVRSEVKPGGGDRRWDRFGRRPHLPAAPAPASAAGSNAERPSSCARRQVRAEPRGQAPHRSRGGEDDLQRPIATRSVDRRRG